MARSSLIAFSWISSVVWKQRPFKVVLSLGNRKSLLGPSPENRVDGTQRMSDVLPDNCGWGATREPVQCRGATSKSGFPAIQTSSCAQHPSNAVKLPGKTVCLPSDHVVQIRDGQCFSNQKTQPTSPWSLNDSSVLFLVEETLSPSSATIASWFQHHTHKLTSYLLFWFS